MCTQTHARRTEKPGGGWERKTWKTKQVEKEVQLRVFTESDRPLLCLFHSKCEMLLARREGIWMYHRWEVVEVMSGLEKLLEGRLERGSCGLSRGWYRGKNQRV